MSPSGSDRFRLRRDRRGATAVEFGLIGIIFVTLLLGVVELGRYYFTVQSLRSVVGDAARQGFIQVNQTLYASTSSNPNAACVGLTLTPNYAALTATAPFLTNPPLTVTYTLTCPVYDTTSTPPAYTRGVIRADATYTFNFIVRLPFIPTSTLTLTDSTFLHLP